MPASAVAVALLLAPQELPIRSWSVAEGLPHEHVTSIFQDSNGALWIGTWEGLARFDGNSFTTYGPEQGLPIGLTFALAESPSGELWFSSNTAGIGRLRLTTPVHPGEPRVCISRLGESPASNAVDEIAFDPHGHAWIATEAGLFLAHEGRDGSLEFERRWAPSLVWSVSGIARSGARIAFLGTDDCLIVEEDEVRVVPGPPGGPPRNDVDAAASADGRAILATQAGLFLFQPDETWLPFDAPLEPEDIVTSTAVGPDGTAWIGTTRGVLEIGPQGSWRIDRRSGLPSENVPVLRFDRGGTLWIGTKNRGLACLPDESIETFVPRGDHEAPFILQVVEARDGTIVASSDHDGLFVVESRALESVPGSEVEPFRRIQGRLAQDQSGDWWLGTYGGLFHVPGPELDLRRAQPIGPREAVGPVHQDPRGELWVCTEGSSIHAGTSTEGFGTALTWRASEDQVREVTFDASGERWVLTWDKLWRWTEDAPEEIRPAEGILPSGEPLRPRSFLEDRCGGLRIVGRSA